jgi:hypothetical protein
VLSSLIKWQDEQEHASLISTARQARSSSLQRNIPTVVGAGFKPAPTTNCVDSSYSCTGGFMQRVCSARLVTIIEAVDARIESAHGNRTGTRGEIAILARADEVIE